MYEVFGIYDQSGLTRPLRLSVLGIMRLRMAILHNSASPDFKI